MKIVITDKISDTSILLKYLPADAEIVILDKSTPTDEEVIEACGDADAAISEYAPFNKNVFDHCPKLKMVSNRAMGVDNINIADAKACKVAIANVPDYCFDEVAEHGMTLIACLLRNAVGYAIKVRAGEWDWSDGPVLKRMSNLTLGLIGCGQIPRRVARMAHGFGMTVVGYDPFLPKEVAEKAGIELVSMEELGARADAVLSHVPLSPDTRHLVNQAVFSTFQKSPVFVNTSRGLTVDQKALCDAVKSGVVSRAMLDVVDKEPADFTDEIFSLENIYFTPHAAFYSEDAHEECHRRAAMNVTNYLAGKHEGISFVVDPAAL